MSEDTHARLSERGREPARGFLAKCKWCGATVVHHHKTKQPLPAHGRSKACHQARLDKLSTFDRLS